jgi:FkbM family methyltransferase
MLLEIDWLSLWRELVIATSHSVDKEPDSLPKRYKDHVRKQGERPDPLLDFVLKGIDGHTTVLDIGAGSGRWTIPLARIAGSVTAIEPSTPMRDMLSENIEAAGLKNIHIIAASWEEAVVAPHNIIVCAHAMYSNPDLSSFIRKQEKHTKRTCYLAIRLPPADGIIGELSLAIYGRSHDSPNAIIAYNALYTLGIYVNVLVENEVYRWVSKTYEDAFAKAKHHLRLETTDKYDKLIRDTLVRRLIPSDDSLIWPDGMRSALLWWSPSPASKFSINN